MTRRPTSLGPVLLAAAAEYPGAEQVPQPAAGPSAQFTGARHRHVLGAQEDIEDCAVDAARRALSAANLQPADIDRLYGYLSVPRYVTPNDLYRIHHRLGLGPETLVVPIASPYSDFLVGMLLAGEALRAGSCCHALVVTASNWTRHVDAGEDYAGAASDAAGAAVLGLSGGQWHIVGGASRTHGTGFHRMTMKIRARAAADWSGIPVDASGIPQPTYHMDPALFSFLQEVIPRVVRDLLHRHQVTSEEITLITHQGSRRLLDHWTREIQPAAHVDTFEQHGNMVSATYAVTLAERLHTITTPYLVIAAVGTGLHATTVLLAQA